MHFHYSSYIYTIYTLSKHPVRCPIISSSAIHGIHAIGASLIVNLVDGGIRKHGEHFAEAVNELVRLGQFGERIPEYLSLAGGFQLAGKPVGDKKEAPWTPFYGMFKQSLQMPDIQKSACKTKRSI